MLSNKLQECLHIPIRFGQPIVKLSNNCSEIVWPMTTGWLLWLATIWLISEIDKYSICKIWMRMIITQSSALIYLSHSKTENHNEGESSKFEKKNYLIIFSMQLLAFINTTMFWRLCQSNLKVMRNCCSPSTLKDQRKYQSDLINFMRVIWRRGNASTIGTAQSCLNYTK